MIYQCTWKTNVSFSNISLNCINFPHPKSIFYGWCHQSLLFFWPFLSTHFLILLNILSRSAKCCYRSQIEFKYCSMPLKLTRKVFFNWRIIFFCNWRVYMFCLSPLFTSFVFPKKHWLGLDLAAGRKEQQRGIPLLLSCPLPVCPCMSVPPCHPPCVSPCQPSVFLPLMLGTDWRHCQTNDCLDHTACQPGCLFYHWDMDSVSFNMLPPTIRRCLKMH